MAYPATLDTLATNKGDATDATSGTPTGGTASDHAGHHNEIATAINAIEAEMGTDPAGLYAATIRERFEIAAFKNQSCKFSTTLGGNLAATYANGTAGVGATLTANPAAAAPTTDAQTWVVGDRVLVKNQTTPAQNGIYTVTQITSPWILTRAIDGDTSSKLADCKVLVDQGTVNGDTEWYQAATNPTVGTTAIYFRRTQPIYGHGNPRSPWTPGQTATSAPVVMETLPRTMVGSTLTPTAGTAFQYLIGGIIVPAGRTVTNINSIYTAAGSSNPSVSWWALVRQSDRITMAHTANSTTLPSTNVVTTRALVTAWTPIEDTPVWIVWSINGNTAPTIVTGLAGNAAANLLAPAMCATNGVAPSATVPTDNSTVITAATTGITTIPYVWLT